MPARYGILRRVYGVWLCTCLAAGLACRVEAVPSEAQAPQRPGVVPEQAIWAGGVDGGSFILLSAAPAANRYAARISKIFNVSLAALAEKRGLLDLEASVARRIPELAGTAFGDLRLMELAMHTSGGTPSTTTSSRRAAEERVMSGRDLVVDGVALPRRPRRLPSHAGEYAAPVCFADPVRIGGASWLLGSERCRSGVFRSGRVR